MSSSDSINKHYLSQCLQLASQSPPKPTNFRVGAVLLIRPPSENPETLSNDRIISTGYTLELPGNTHAEQSCLKKLASKHDVFEEQVGRAIKRECESSSHNNPDQIDAERMQVIMYVTMEPCGKRLSGNTPCVERIIQTRKEERGVEVHGIDMVYFGVKEPGTFVGESRGCKMLDEAGIKWRHVEGMEDEILKVATEGHKQNEEEEERSGGTNVDDISEEERRRQEQLPRNPKKRMMEV